MLNQVSWDEQEIDDFLSMRLPEEETRNRIISLTPETIDGQLFQSFLRVMRSKALPLPITKIPTMDCCGTGGSGIPRFNASTTSAFILAAGGVPTVKFGNRGVSSRSGSFDLLERLGIPEQWPLTALPDILNDCGLVFLYAPQVYPDFQRFTALRKSIGGRTVFNFMGPLLNPIVPTYRLLGVSHLRMQGMIAEVIRQEPKTSRAWVVRAETGLDEISPDGVTDICDINGNLLNHREYTPEFQPFPFDVSLKHTPQDNVEIFHGIVAGEDGQSAYHRISCLNAGAGFYLAGKTTTFEDGVLMAEDLLFNKKVAEVVDKVRKIYGRLH